MSLKIAMRGLMMSAVVATLTIGCSSEAPIGIVQPENPSVSAMPADFEEFVMRQEEVGPLSLDRVVEAVSKVTESQPGLQSDLLGERVWNELVSSKESGRRAEVSAAGSYPYHTTRLEFWLLVTHPTYASKTKLAADKASSEAIRQWPTMDQHNTKADAFRHAYWNVLLSKSISVSWASQYTAAHESESPTGLEKSMDLNNNAVGRGIYINNSSKTESQLSTIVKNYRYDYVTSIYQSFAYLVYITR